MGKQQLWSARGWLNNLVNGANVLGAGNFSLEKDSTSTWVPLNNNGADERIGIAPYGIETAFDAKLFVPLDQPGGAYTGTVVLTFANEV